jgi:hypothetical protein
MQKVASRLLAIGVPLALLAWYFRPIFHDLVMSFIVSPLQGILIIILFVGIYFFAKKIGKLRLVQVGPGNYSFQPVNGLPTKSIFLYSSIFTLVLLMTVFGLVFESEIRYYLTSKQVTFDTRKDLPVVEPIRLTPKPVAARYAQDTFQSPQEKLGDSQIVLENGRMVRVFPRIPDGTLLYFINKLTGFVTVDVDTLERKVNISNQTFKYADGIGITDNIYFQLEKKKFFVNYSSEPIYLKDDKGQWVTIVPYMNYEKFPFRVPVWGGVMVVRSDGSIDDLTPAQTEQVSYMKGNRIYPKELTSYYTEAYAYKGGLLNKWFLHKDQVEIVSLGNDERTIHTATKEGFKQIVVAEPYGRSYGIYRIFIVDATTGKREIIEYDQNSQLTGPISAADYIKKSFPTYNWNNFTLAEPRPLTIKGELYWLLSVVPNDSAGIATTVLLDAKTNKVTEVKTEQDLKAFLDNQSVVTAPQTVGAKDNNTQIKEKIDLLTNELNSLKALIDSQVK